MAAIAYASEGKNVYDFFFINHLAKNNCVYLLTFSEKPYLVPQNVHIVRIHEPFHPSVSPMKGLYAYGTSFLRSILLRRYLNMTRPDVLISSWALSYGFYGGLSNYSPNILLVWGSDVLVAPKLFPFRFMAKYSLKKASAVVLDSDVQEKACIALGCDPKKIVKFPWVDLQLILSNIEKNADDKRRNADKFREKLGWHEDDPVIISTRHHEPIYNMECLMQAVPSVVEEVPTARFLILGEGSLTEKLKKSAATMGVSANVKFLGRVPFSEIPKYLEMADIYVSTSLSDGTSASLIEAMACKLPVIVTDIPGNREWIIDRSNGLLFPIQDHKSLAENIVKLFKDDASRKSLGKKAYETVMEKADWQKNSKLLDKLIFSLSNINHNACI